jgi:hypothetical protein
MTRFDAVLIYDGECPYCSVAARALERIENVGALSWYDDAAQSFLEAQFGETPFAMVLVDPDEAGGTVYAGRGAAEELSTRAGLPSLVGSLVRDNYDSIAKVVGLASGRGREAADCHGRFALTDDGRTAFDGLASAATARDLRVEG